MIVEVIILNLPGSAERVRAQRAAQVNALIRSHLAVAFPTLLETEEASASDVEGMTEGETGCSDGDDDELVSEVHNFDITKPNSGCMTTSESEQDDILDWRRRYRIQEYESLAIQIAGSSVREKRIGSYLLRASGGHRYRRQEKETCDSVSAAAEIANVAQIADKSGDIAISPSKRVGQPRISEDLPRALRQHNRSPRNRFARPLDWLRRKAWARSKQQQTTLSKQDAIFALDPLTKTEENMDYFSVLDIGGIRTEVIVIPARRLEEAQKASWPVRLLSSGRKSLSMSSMGSSFSADDPQISAFNDSNSVSDTSPTNQELPLTLVPTEKRSPPDTTMPERTKASDRNPSVAATQVLGGRRRPSEGSSPRITRRVRSQDHGTIRIGNESRVGHEHPRREHATYLELSGPEAYPMTALATKRIRRRQCQVVFLPGNPGCIELYESFLLHCASILASAKHPQYDFIVHGVGLAGHDLRGLNRPGRFYDLADQTRHKLAYIRDHLHSPGDGNDDTLVLVGHSTGAHIICRLLEEDPALAERAQVILLTPAIADVADGIRTAFRQRAFIFQRGARQLTAGLASTILRIAPERMIDDLVDEFLAHRATPAVARRIRDLFRLAADKYHLFINILALAADKCLHIGDMNISLLRRFAARLVMYYVPNDPFAPSEQCARVRTEVPEAHVEFEQERVYHGFILNEHQTLRVASKVAHWVLEAVCQSPAESGFGDG
jgi:pimeloyl-ACP methyl ester carboxylesterase